jgi:hypothetical protein
MANFIKMKEQSWFDKYKPIKNHFDDNASFDGYMFETYGEEWEFVKSQPLNTIWTFIHGDYDTLFLDSGMHIVNRIGYFVTTNPYPDDTVVEVVIAEPEYHCPNPDCNVRWQRNAAVLHHEKFYDLEKCAACATMDELKTIEDFPLTLDESEQ